MQLPFHLRNLTVLGSQPALFCRYSAYKKQYKGGTKHFSSQNTPRSSYKAFQSGDRRSMTKKSTKRLYSSSAVHFEAKNFLTGPLYCILYLEYRQNKAGWLPRSPRIDSYNMGKMRRQTGQFSQVKWKLQSFLTPPNLQVRSVSCNKSAIKRWLNSKLEETVFSLTRELFMTQH